ncbi:MAG TPA: ABC transporter ATP-binding protein [Bacteroidota bacterium]
MIVIKTNQLSKTYSSGYFKKSLVPALVDVSLEVNSGEIFGLLGPNGAGKTTFIKLLLSIVHPTSGSAELLGLPIGRKQSRVRCGYLPENHRYPLFLTALETLLLFGQLDGLQKQPLKSKAQALLEFVGLKDWSNQKVQKFSKGMLQRLGLAQALLNDPELLFLDEPTDGVDPLGRKEMRDLFLKLKDSGVSIFLNSHLLSEVEMISDRVAILNKGTLIKVGTLDEVRGGPTTHQIQIEGSLSPEQLRALAMPQSHLNSDASGTTLFVQSDTELNRTIDLLRTWGIMIKGITQQRSTLEDSFVKLVTGGNPL